MFEENEMEIFNHILKLEERVHGSASWAELDYSINTNPLGPPKSVLDFLQKESSLSWLIKYPEVNANLLKECLACKFGVEKNQLIVGNGAAELFFLLPKVLKINKGIVVHPTFGEYEASLLAANVPIERLYYSIDGDEFVFPKDELERTVTEGDLIYLCRPNNPTGQMIPLSEVKEILSLAEEHKAILLVDESFVDFTDEPEGLLNIFNKDTPLILVRSLTKFYTIPGIRLGYLIASEWLVKNMELARDPWSVNALAQKIGLKLVEDKQFFIQTRDWIKNERSWFYQQFSNIESFKIYPSNTNFHLVKSLRFAPKDIAEYLQTKGIAIRLANSFKGLDDKYFRLAVRLREENQEFLKEMKAFVESKK